MSFGRRSFTIGQTLTFALLLVACAGSASHAQPVIGGWGGGSVRTDGGIVAGNSFNALSSQTINALGFIDLGQDGISGSYQIGLWDSSQNLIASGTVTPASPLIGDFRWVAITPVSVSGTFTFGALLPSNPADPWLDQAFPVLSFGYTGAGTGQWETSGTLVYPTNFDSSRYVVANAGNMEIVPEPTTLSLIIGSGLVLFRRSRR